jgi:hypothetical protein
MPSKPKPTPKPREDQERSDPDELVAMGMEEIARKRPPERTGKKR